VALYVKHADHSEQLLPENDLPLRVGDQLLFCGRPDAETHMRWSARNLHALSYVNCKYDLPSGSLWRRFHERRGREGNA
jgi:hypothetical protein